MNSRHLLRSTLQGLQSGTLDCVSKNSLQDMTAVAGCVKFNDPAHPVPYRCTNGRKICCEVKSIYNATFPFGSCIKVQSPATTPTAKPPTRKPTRKPTKKPASSVNTSDNIDCKWFSYFKQFTPVQACKQLNDPAHPAPYLCKDGRKVCCSVSNVVTVNLDAFGTCSKVQ